MLTAKVGRKAVAAAVAMALAPASMPSFAQDDSALEEVTVTGSRIVRRDFIANSPIVTLESESFENVSTVAIETVLNQLPQFVPALTQFSTMDVQNSATNTPGASTLNLRGLGPNRNLVLIDGRRGQPLNGSLIVDINSIPSAAVQRVEIITGGASAVYGADAVSGVVNFILKKDFEGIDIDAQYGATEHGDANELRVSALMGTNLSNGRGNVMLGLEHASREAAYSMDRDFFRRGWADPTSTYGRASRLSDVYWNPNWQSNRPSQEAVDALFGAPGATVNGPFFFSADNTIYQEQGVGLEQYNGPWTVDKAGAQSLINNYVNLGGTGDIAYRYLDDTGRLRENQLGTMISNPLTRYSAFGRLSYDVTDKLTYFAQVQFADTRNKTRRVWSPAAGGWAVVIPHGDEIYAPSVDENGNTLREYQEGGIYGLNCGPVGGCTNSEVWPVPDDLAALLASRPDPNAPFVLESPALRQIGDRGIDNNTTTYQVVTGLMGELPLRDWTWELYGSHGRTRVISYMAGTVSVENLRALAAAPNYGRNASITGNTLIDPAGFGGKIIRCESGLHYFDVSKEISQDCITAIEGRMVHMTTLSQNIVEANLQGGLANMPAGELRAAVGASFRSNRFDYHVDKLEQVQNIADLPAGLFGSGSTDGYIEAREIYGELLVPLLSDAPAFRRLELDLGYRYSDYNAVGGLSTYKALIDWEVNDTLRFRGGYNLATRAPNVGELFQNDTTTVVFSNVGDPCLANTAAPYGNNPNNPDRQRVIDLCNILINDPSSDYSLDPLNYRANEVPGGIALGDITGNQNLDAEEAKTWTFGAIIRSPFENPWLDRLTASIDYYRIRVDGTIGTLSYDQTYQQCFDPQFNPNYDPENEFCRRIRRDPGTGDSGSIGLVNVNRGMLETAGYDLQVNWSAALADLGFTSIRGTVSWTILANYLDYDRIQAVADGPIEDFSGTGTAFRYRINNSLAYRTDSFGITLRHRFLPGQKHPSSVTDPQTTSIGPRDYHIFDLVARWAPRDTIDLRAGIDNLFDRDPMITSRSPTSTGQGITDAGYYDVLGRRYYVGMRVSF